MPHYTAITIIYNPNSTGPGKVMADTLVADLHKKLPKVPVEIVPTERAGHGQALSLKYAQKTARPLIISASGDGGYHDVINGVLEAQANGAKPVAGLLPAGNANDHFHNLHEKELVDEIVRQNEKTIDLIFLSSIVDGKPFKRYAHSYLGFGLTPKAGLELNKTKLNKFNEALIVAKVLFTLKPVQLIVAGEQHAYDSLVFSNVDRMSKFLSLSESSVTNDGMFEVTTFRRRNKLRLIGVLLKATTVGLKGDNQYKTYEVTTVEKTVVQLDGEIVTLDANAKVLITLKPQILQCIV